MLHRTLILLFLSLASMQAALFELKFNNLKPSLSRLSPEETKIVDRSIGLIRKGENTLALAQLSTLSKANPSNSALQVLMSYALLQIGNKLGAFDAAKQAEASPDHTGYVCYFFAKVAFLTGDSATCKREIAHVKSLGLHKKEIKELESEVEKSGQ